MIVPQVSPPTSRAILCAFLLGGWLGGCAPDRVPPLPTILVTERLDLEQAAMNGGPADGWWRDYGDAQLDELVALALTQAPTLDLARARQGEAEAALALSQSGDWPAIDLDGAADRERESKTGLVPPPLAGKVLNSAQASLGLSYQLDLWGKRHSAIAAAQNQVAATGAEVAAAQLFLIGAVAQAYYALQTDLQRQALTVDTALLWTDLLTLSEARLKSGRDAIGPSLEAKASHATARLSQEQAAVLVAVDRHQLAALAGTAASRLPPLPGHKLPEEPVMPSVLSIDLLARRPEVEANRRGVVAAADQVDVARAGFYPDIGITALAGQSTLQLGQFLSPGSRIWSVGPALHLPLFEGGRLHATLGVAQAELDQAIAAYNQSVIDAVQQAATAFAQWAGADRQVRQAEAALEQARRLAALQRGRLDGGLADRSASLQAELAVLSGEEVLLDLRGRRLAYNIALQVALGGGYRAPLPSAKPNNPAMSP